MVGAGLAMTGAAARNGILEATAKPFSAVTVVVSSAWRRNVSSSTTGGRGTIDPRCRSRYAGVAMCRSTAATGCPVFIPICF
jgi:hypothetical protein